MNEFDVFVEAAEKDPTEVDGFLSDACEGSPGMRSRIDALLQAHRGPGFLDDLDPRQPDWQPPKIHGFKLLEQIGEGAFGNVYMAEQVAPIRRRVAVKVVKLGMDTKQVVARFDAERQAMAMMDHPSIATVYDAGATNHGRPYFAMELVRGESITAYCDNQRLGTRERLELIVSVCRAIQHAHQKGVIHRDIKPSNVMVTNHDGKALAKVIDFGIAKATAEPLTDKTLFTQFRQMIGTPSYMSPEQAELNASDVDTRSDVYSLGVLLYELLSGKTPLEITQSSYEDILRSIRETEPPTLAARLNSLEQSERSTIADRRRLAPTELVRIVNGELNWIVAKALSKDRTRRYDTASALADDIERYLINQPVIARPPSTSYRFSKFISRNRALVASLSVVLAALVIGLGIAIAGLGEAQNQAQLALLESEKAINQAEIAQTERKNALRQAHRAEKTFEMLRDLLIAVDPDQGHGLNYTVREALNEFVKTLPSRLDGTMPDVEAEINSIIGNAFNNLTMRYDAEEFLRRAVELRQTADPVDHIRLAESYMDLARNAMKRCNPYDAKDAAELAVESYKAKGIEAPGEVAAILTLSRELHDLRQFLIKKADEFHHHEARQRLNNVLDNNPETLTGTLFMRSVFHLLDIGEYEKAITVCLLEPADLDINHSEEERNVRAILNGALTIIYREHKSPELAGELYPSIRSDADGDANWFQNNPWQKSFLAMGILYDPTSSSAQRKRAKPLAKEFSDMLGTRRAAHSTALARHVYALALAHDNEFEEAELTLREALEIVPQSLLFLHGVLERQLADVLERSGKLEDAETVFRNAVYWREKKLPGDYVQNSVAEMNLAMFLQRVGSESSMAEAIELLETAYQRVSGRPEDDCYRRATKDALDRLATEISERGGAIETTIPH